MHGIRNVEVVVQLDGGLSERWRTGQRTGPDAAQLQAVLAGAGAELRPQHPGVNDPELSRWFVAYPHDGDEGTRLVAALIALPCVNAAYAKPAAELPL